MWEKYISVRPTAIVYYSFVPAYHPICLPAALFHTFIAAKSPPCRVRGRGGFRKPFPATPCRWQRLRANAVRPYGL